ncbi:MAG: anaerobic sulfatase maturase [Planctomycetota bacterium]|jgi:uncharacterized protein
MKPFTLLIKPSGSDCNIDCAYCFYKGRSGQVGQGRQRMSEEVLERLVKDYMELGLSVSGFAWQGGEPTLMGVDFFAGAVELQKRYGRVGQQVSNKMQTNGVLLDEKWCRFLHENKFLLGISIDGPKEFHDKYRLDYSGAGTFEKVMRGIECCKDYDVEFSALIVLNNANVEDPERLFGFILENDLTYLQFIPCIERDPQTGEPAEFSITPQQYGEFLCRLFDLWVEHGPEKLNIRDFDSLVTYYVMGEATMCTYSKQCTGFVVIEHNGDAYCCEFFVEPDWRIGNIMEIPLPKLAADSRKRTFARNKQRLCSQCLLCAHLDICRGGCVKDRMRITGDGPDQASYFCEAYKQFFDHAKPRMMQIAADIESGRLGRRTRAADKIRMRIE